MSYEPRKSGTHDGMILEATIAGSSTAGTKAIEQIYAASKFFLSSNGINTYLFGNSFIIQDDFNCFASPSDPGCDGCIRL